MEGSKGGRQARDWPASSTGGLLDWAVSISDSQAASSGGGSKTTSAETCSKSMTSSASNSPARLGSYAFRAQVASGGREEEGAHQGERQAAGWDAARRAGRRED